MHFLIQFALCAEAAAKGLRYSAALVANALKVDAAVCPVQAIMPHVGAEFPSILIRIFRRAVGDFVDVIHQ